MSEKPTPRHVADAWLLRAEGHLKTARHISLDPNLPSADAAFHAQQVAELSLKAFLLRHGHTVARTHDLVALVRECQDIYPYFREFTAQATSLGAYAVEARYPPLGLTVSREDAAEAIATADKIYSAVRARFGPTDVSSGSASP